MKKCEYIVLKEGTNLDKKSDSYVLMNEKFNLTPIVLNEISVILLQQINGLNTFDDIIKIIKKLVNNESILVEKKVEHFLKLINQYLLFSNSSQKNKEVLCGKIEKIENAKPDRILVRKKTPQMITFMLTNCCARECIYCYAGSKKINGKDFSNSFLSVSRFKEVIKEAETIGVEYIEIGGGDPFKHYNIMEYLKVIGNSKIKNYLISTKEYLSEKVSNELMNIGIKRVQVSLDSCDKEIADYLMGVKGSFVQVEQSIENLVNSDIEVSVNAVLTSENIVNAFELIDFLYLKGVYNVSFSLYGMSCGRHDESLYPSINQIKCFIKKMNDFKNENIKIQYPKVDINEEEAKRSKDLGISHYYRSICGALNRRLTVDENGNVKYCAYMPSVEEVIVGNLKKDSIMEIWNSKKTLNLLTPIKENYTGTDCYSCDEFINCFNRRCNMRIYSKFKTIYEKDPLCKYSSEI